MNRIPKTPLSSHEHGLAMPGRRKACFEELRTGLLVAVAVTSLLGAGLARASVVDPGASAPAGTAAAAASSLPRR
jgi:hypothetical protein